MIPRRKFLTTAAVTAGSLLSVRTGRAADSSGKRQFTLSLRASSIGVKADQREAMRLAARHGFEAVTPDPGFLTKLSDTQISELTDRLNSLDLVWGAAGLPVEYRKDEATFREGLAGLPEKAAAMRAAGVTRVGTWVTPASDDLTYTQNMKQHAARLSRCARVLADHGQRFGLEYVGPQTSLISRRYPFVHTMAETKDLIAAIGIDGVGFILDSWHWYTAGETVDDLLTLTNRDVVACDLNDAPLGRTREQQIDNQRELPMATGVIDLAGFLGGLIEIGYDGPVRAEPFNQPLAAMDNEAACAATAEAMKSAFALAERA